MNPNLILYACVAKRTTILAEFNSRDADLGALAAQCLEKTPLLHSLFSHTIRSRTYTFFVDDPFVYFGIFDEKLEKSDGISFLKSVRDSFDMVIGSNPAKLLEDLNSHCFQGEFNPVFHQLLASSSYMESPQSPRVVLKHDRSVVLDSPRGKKIGSMPLLGNACKGLKKKKKKRLFGGETNGGGKEFIKEKKVDVSDDDDVDSSREFSMPNHKNGLFAGDAGHQKAKRVWKKQVWVVLCLDFILCCILFAVWLWICRGFKCIDG